jgi:hypothetical protein
MRNKTRHRAKRTNVPDAQAEARATRVGAKTRATAEAREMSGARGRAAPLRDGHGGIARDLRGVPALVLVRSHPASTSPRGRRRSRRTHLRTRATFPRCVFRRRSIPPRSVFRPRPCSSAVRIRTRHWSTRCERSTGTRHDFGLACRDRRRPGPHLCRRGAAVPLVADASTECTE